MSNIQAVYASVSDFSADDLLKWIKSHGLKPIKDVHISGENLRYRIKRPNPYKKYYTKVLPNKVHLVIEY
jgi:hypothetical protein